MKMDCPHGLLKLGVTVYDGVCDSCDICLHQPCEYFDGTDDGTERFTRARDAIADLEALARLALVAWRWRPPPTVMATMSFSGTDPYQVCALACARGGAQGSGHGPG